MFSIIFFFINYNHVEKFYKLRENVLKLKIIEKIIVEIKNRKNVLKNNGKKLKIFVKN